MAAFVASAAPLAPGVAAPPRLLQARGVAARPATAPKAAAAPAQQGVAAAALLAGLGALGRPSKRGGRRCRVTALRASAAEEVDRFIADNSITVFSKSWCPFCTKAKNALNSVGAKFTVVELDQRDDGDAIQDALLAKTGGRSVPRVFIGGDFIGGGDDTAAKAANGELAKLVADAGAAAALVGRRNIARKARGGDHLEDMQASKTSRWTLRSSDLKKSLDFCEKVLDMKVLRHEESEKPCETTTNGAYDKAWSRTVVGYGPESSNFALEFTSTDGVRSYKEGSGFTHVCVGVDDPEAALQKAEELGYKVEADIISGPDDYDYRVMVCRGADPEFIYVGLRVSELPKALEYYGNVLGMQDMTWEFEHLAFNRGGTDLMRVVGYPDQVSLMFYEDPMKGDERLVVKEWDGRLTQRVPEEALKAAIEEAEKAKDGGVVHNLKEEPGLVVAVIKDGDGYEVCMESSERAGGSQEIDWAAREKRA